MDMLAEERRRAFAWWIRTGRLRPPQGRDGLELKFNPYHDPHNGRFTFASGGGATGGAGGTHTSAALPDVHASETHLAAAEGSPITVRGSNIRAFDDPHTLEQVFPGLQNAPGGTVLAAADDVLDLSGPARQMSMEVLTNTSRRLQEQIKAFDPTWHYDKLDPITTIQGMTNEVNYLRFEQAAAIARVRGDYGPLQVETTRLIQQSADSAYDDGKELQKAGKLKARLSDPEALGNYVDKEVRRDLRERYNQANIDSGGSGRVRVNCREYDTSGDRFTYRQPDARVGDVALDVTLSRKSISDAQIRGFFSADFRPTRVVIVRPTQLGGVHTYVITRPETKR